jgi:hypothetical protein
MDRFGYPGPFVAAGLGLALLAIGFRRFLRAHPMGVKAA